MMPCTLQLKTRILQAVTFILGLGPNSHRVHHASRREYPYQTPDSVVQQNRALAENRVLPGSLLQSSPLLVHARRQDRHFNRIEEHRVGIGIAETMPSLARCDRPALRLFDLFRLQDTKEPALRTTVAKLAMRHGQRYSCHRPESRSSGSQGKNQEYYGGLYRFCGI